jgi:2',3'-cyclic-nucleotide 2'-phosphodiesterase (5'-nucleotidase family)
MERLSMHRTILVTLGALSLAPTTHAQAPTAAAGATTRLVIAATTDVHGRLRGWDYYEGRQDPARSLAAAATVVDSIRAAAPDRVVLVDAGDLLQGNPLTTVAARGRGAEPHPVVAAMNAMRYDAAAIGNHEFNYGLALMDRALGEARFPFLSANSRRLRGGPAFKGWTLVRRGDVTVGVVGATTPGVMVWDRDHVRGRVTVGDIVPAVRRAADEARRAGADVVVAVIHAGLDGPASYDTVTTRLPGENVVARVAREVPGLDLVVYGHSHRELADTMIGTVRLLQPRNHAASVGVATLDLERAGGRWRVRSSTGRTIPVQGHAEHPAVLAATERGHARALAYVSETLAVATRRFAADSARAVDTPIADLIGEVMRRAAGTDLAAAPVFSLQAQLDSGPVTVAEVARLYPFDNTLRAVRLTGAQLRSFLEHSARYWKQWAPGTTGSLLAGVPGYNFDMVVGADYALDLSRPVGDRVRDLRVRGRPVADGDRFTIALSNYRQGGGGGFQMVADAPLVFDSQVDIRELIVRELRARKRIAPEDVHVANWRIVPVEAAAAAYASLTRERRGPTGGPATGASRRLRVIGINDFHGTFTPRPDGRGTRYGGAGQFAARIRELERECRPPQCTSILLDGGDEFQGTPASNLAYGRPVVSFFDSLGVVAGALGNHEFDWGQDTLRARMRDARYAILGANVRDTTGRRPAWLRADTLVERDGLRIGVIGIATVETPNTTRASNVADLRFIDPAPVVDEHAKALRARGADAIVLVAHAGAFEGRGGADATGEIVELVSRLTQPIDAVVSGHTHSYLNIRVRGVPVVQARSNGRAVASIDLALGERPTQPGWIAASRVVDARVRDVLTDSVVPDPQGARIAQRALDEVAPIADRPIGRIVDAMPRGRGGEYALGNLMADAFREATRSDVAVMNPGGVRADLAAGQATYGTLYEIAPFANVLYVVTVRGDALQRYLGRLVSGAQGPRAFVSGATIAFDPSRPPDERLVEARIAGRPIDPAREYTLTLSDFLLTGGDGLGLANAALRTVAANVVDLDALIAYVRARPDGVRAPETGRFRSTAPVTP